MVKESQEAFKAQARKKSTYFSSRNVEHVRLLFESTWCGSERLGIPLISTL